MLERKRVQLMITNYMVIDEEFIYKNGGCLCLKTDHYLEPNTERCYL